MKHTVFLESYAQKQIVKLDSRPIPKIRDAIATLAENPRPQGCIKLKGEEAYRIRIGFYRIIYEIPPLPRGCIAWHLHLYRISTSLSNIPISSA